MAPERPPKLAVLDLRFEDATLLANLDYVEVLRDNERLRVRWNEEHAPLNFVTIAGGVAHVEDADYVVHVPKGENARPTSLGHSKYRWSEGLDPKHPWLMLVVILPEGYTIADPHPVPREAKEFGKRLALYWILKGDELGRTELEFGLKSFESEVQVTLEKINNRYKHHDIPEEVGIDVDTFTTKDYHSLHVFLCHSSNDKQSVRKLYQQLRTEGFDPWLDEEKLLPGQNWDLEIRRALRNSQVVIVCLSSGSITKSGYVQKELRQALDVANEQPDDTIFIIPARLDDCTVPDRLREWQWVNLYESNGLEKLLLALRKRADAIKRTDLRNFQD